VGLLYWRIQDKTSLSSGTDSSNSVIGIIHPKANKPCGDHVATKPARSHQSLSVYHPSRKLVNATSPDSVLLFLNPSTNGIDRVRDRVHQSTQMKPANLVAIGVRPPVPIGCDPITRRSAKSTQ
jgi:hypothetical protein